MPLMRLLSVAGAFTRSSTPQVEQLAATVAFPQYRCAGVRRKAKVKYGSEFFMVNRAFKAIRRSDVCLLVLDALEGLKDQDRALADRITDEGRACVVLLNKWDAVQSKDDETYNKAVKFIRETLPNLRWADVLLISAKTGQRVNKIYDAVDAAAKAHRKRFSTSVLNEVLRDAILWQAPPANTGSRAAGRIYYCSQISIQPPTIALFCNNANVSTCT
jgi:GTP-binding protein